MPELWGWYSTLVSNEEGNEHNGWLKIMSADRETCEKREKLCKQNASRINSKFEIR